MIVESIAFQRHQRLQYLQLAQRPVHRSHRPRQRAQDEVDHELRSSPVE
jgi:hypothetical protein